MNWTKESFHHQKIPAEVLIEDSIKGAPAVLSTISKDALFTADVHEIIDALLESAEGDNSQQRDVLGQIICNIRAYFCKGGQGTVSEQPS